MLVWMMFTSLSTDAALAEEACVPVDLAREVPALLATTPPEPDGPGADAWLALEARFRANLACSSLLDRRDLATLYLGAANVTAAMDPGRSRSYLQTYARLAPDAPRRFSLDSSNSPIGTIPMAEVQDALGSLPVAGSARVSTRTQVWLDGRGVRPGDVVELEGGEHLLQEVRTSVRTRAVSVEAGQSYELVRPGRSLRVGLAATGGALIAGGVAALVWGYGREQRADDVQTDRDAVIGGWLAAGVGLTALGTGGLVAAAAWSPEGDVQVRLSGRFE